MLKSKTFQVIAIVVVCFATAEAILQIRASIRFGESRATYIVPDPLLGRVLTPNYRRQGTLGILTINEHGRRGKSFTTVPNKGAIRLACLGSSVVFGGGTALDDEDVFPFVLEAELRQRYPAQPLDVINAACPGWNSNQVLLDFENRLIKYKPDVVLIYAVANDIGEVMKRRDRAVKQSHSLSFLNGTLHRYSVLYNAFRDYFKFLRPEVAGAVFQPFPIEDGIALFTNNYRKLIHSARNNGVVPILVTEPHAFRREQPLHEQERLMGGIAWGLGLQGSYQAHDALNGTLRALAVTEKCLLIDLARLMPGGEEYFIDAIHLSKKGHALVGKILANELGALGFPDQLSGWSD